MTNRSHQVLKLILNILYENAGSTLTLILDCCVSRGIIALVELHSVLSSNKILKSRFVKTKQKTGHSSEIRVGRTPQEAAPPVTLPNWN